MVANPIHHEFGAIYSLKFTGSMVGWRDKDVRMEGGDDLYPKWSVGLRLDLGEGLRLIWREKHR